MERRSGNKELSSPPYDVYLEIIKCFHSPRNQDSPYSQIVAAVCRKNLGNIALVCQLFHFIASPMMFRTLYIHPGKQSIDLMQSVGGYGDKTWQTEALSICSLIKDCTINLYASYDYDRSVVPHSVDLPHLQNLTTLTFLDSRITRDILRSLTHLTQLTSLSLINFTLSSNVQYTDLAFLASGLRERLTALSLFFRYKHSHSKKEYLPSGIRMSDVVPLATNSYLTKLHTN